MHMDNRALVRGVNRKKYMIKFSDFFQLSFAKKNFVIGRKFTSRNLEDLFF